MKQLTKTVGWVTLTFLLERVAYADNCGSLSDCFSTIGSATAAAVGVAVMVIVGMITDLFKMEGEAEAGETPQNKDSSERAIDMDKAVEHLNSNAYETSQHHCAQYVRQAIEAGGITLERPASGYAKDYGPSLENAGFKKIPKEDYSPQKGDVIILQPPPGRDAGHIQMYNGERWVSDFNQSKDIYPGPGYREKKVPYEIYRP